MQKNITALWLISLFIFLPWHNTTALESAESSEIKAVFLFNLGNYMRWTDKQLGIEQNPFYICILGKNPFGGSLNFIQKNRKKISEHPVAINYIEKITQTENCKILFISDSETPHLSNIFTFLKGQPILTVGDSTSFVIQGGMIQFYERDNKIRLLMDPETIDETGIKVSANLMRVVKVIEKDR